MAPEIILELDYYDETVDVFSFGVVLAEILSRLVKLFTRLDKKKI